MFDSTVEAIREDIRGASLDVDYLSRECNRHVSLQSLMPSTSSNWKARLRGAEMQSRSATDAVSLLAELGLLPPKVL